MVWIGTALQIIWGVLSFMLERNSEKKKQKKEALKEILDGIESHDPSAVTSGFDHLNRS